MADSKENRDAMSFRQLVTWAWRLTCAQERYQPAHSSDRRANVCCRPRPPPLVVAVIALAALWVHSVFQGVGHSLERQQVPPFTGPRDFCAGFTPSSCDFWRLTGAVACTLPVSPQ